MKMAGSGPSTAKIIIQYFMPISLLYHFYFKALFMTNDCLYWHTLLKINLKNITIMID